MSRGLVLDTNIVSFILKKDTRAKIFEPFLTGKILALSFMTEAELLRWSLERKWGTRKTSQLEKALLKFVVLPYDRELGWQWSRIKTECGRVGETIAHADAWIAATACRHELPLLTHNLKHFKSAETYCGLELLRVNGSVSAE